MQERNFNNKETMIEINNDILKKLHIVQVEILDEFVRICDKNSLRYFLIGGTLLGAVRHKGFIPWDDDLDVAMPRKDYEKFLLIAKRELKKQYYLHDISTDKNYWLPFAKIRKNGTVYSEKRQVGINNHKGIWVDIFPLDNAKDPELYKLQKKRVWIAQTIKEVVHYRTVSEEYNDNYPRKKIRALLSATKWVPVIWLSRIEKLIMMLNTNEDSTHFVNIGSQYGYHKQTIRKDIYEPAIELSFEGKHYKVPKDYNYILNRLYGDYMKLPPKDKRVNHNPTEISFYKL